MISVQMTSQTRPAPALYPNTLLTISRLGYPITTAPLSLSLCIEMWAPPQVSATHPSTKSIRPCPWSRVIAVTISSIHPTLLHWPWLCAQASVLLRFPTTSEEQHPFLISSPNHLLSRPSLLKQPLLPPKVTLSSSFFDGYSVCIFSFWILIGKSVFV